MSETRVSAYAWYVAAVLMLTYAVQHIDRQIMAVVLEPVKAEFRLSDSQLGLLSGLAFAVAYSLAVIPLGALVDRGNRRNLLATALAVWSGMTALGSLVSGYVQLVAARLLVGAAEAGGSPAAISIIADTFPRERRSGATGLFFFGQGIGILAGFALGGFVVSQYGWRTTLLMAGVPGLILSAVILLTVREPSRSTDRHGPVASGEQGFSAALGAIWHRRSLFWLLLATLFGSAMVAAIMIWVISFLVRTHELDLRSAGLAVGLGMGLSGALGAATGGFVADWAARQRARNVPLQLAISQGLAICAFATAFLVADPMIAVVGCSLGILASHMRDGPVYAWIAMLAGERYRGRVVAVTFLLNNLVGYGLGPLLAGALSDFYARTSGADALQDALLSTVGLGALGIVPFLLAARTVETDLAEAEQAA